MFVSEEPAADAILSCFGSDAERDDEGSRGANVVDGLFAMARALDRVANAIHRLGNADANTPMGGLEALGAVLKDGLAQIAIALNRDS